MEEEVRKWLKKKMEEVGTQDSSPLPEVKSQTKPNDMSKEVDVETEIQKSIDFPKEHDVPTTEVSTAEKILEESEGEKPHESSKEPSHSGIEKGLEAPKIKDNMSMEIEVPKTFQEERPEPLPVKEPTFNTKAKVIMILIVVLVAFLVSWFYFFYLG
jgi:FtsZ-interacting cell division protein ZipA